MLKLGIYFHLFFGLVSLPFFPPLSALFFTIAAVLILLVIGSKKADILEEWSMLVHKAHGQRDRVISKTKELIISTKAPAVMMNEGKVGPSLAIASFGETRDFLIITNRVNSRLSNFKTFVNANDYGENLFVSWYLTYRPDFLQALIMLMPGSRKTLSIDDLNLFNKQDLTAYVTNVHHCLQEAVESLMTDLNQDLSKIERKSRGFLGIS